MQKLYMIFLSDKLDYSLVEIWKTEELAESRLLVLNEMEGNAENPAPWRCSPVELKTSIDVD